MNMDNGLPAIHPGAFLAEILEELNLSQAQFAKALQVSPMRISHLIKGNRPVTADMALRLGKALQQSPRYWLNLQADFDIKQAAKDTDKELEAIKPIAA
ncbi:MAG: HigA family addiction module antitoxin [Thiolinea sp.]